MSGEQLEALTAKEFEDWIPIKRVVNEARLGIPVSNLAVETIYRRLSHGQMRSGAMSWAESQSRSGGVVEIEPVRWGQLSSHEILGIGVWLSGDLMVNLRTPQMGKFSRTYFGVRCDPAGVAALLNAVAPPALPSVPLAATVAPAAAAPPAKHAGGAPRKDFWDDLWAAIGALIYRGKIHPGSKSKDVENAMVQWAIDHDEELSVPSARIRARKLLEELRQAEKDNN